MFDCLTVTNVEQTLQEENLKVFHTAAISERQRQPCGCSSSTSVDALDIFITYSWARMGIAAVLESNDSFSL